MFDEEGMTAVFSRHVRHAEATRRAVRGWGLDIVCRNPDDYSSTLTAVMVPGGHDADQVRQLILDRYNMSLGAGLGRLAGRVFRIGHLGDLSDLSLAGALCGVEMGLARAGVPIARDGVSAALDYLGSAA
jgi:alanine-glyoxylate transaminase/serine-glyoxylate transaminase/serine-pyruvate transaminase